VPPALPARDSGPKRHPFQAGPVGAPLDRIGASFRVRVIAVANQLTRSVLLESLAVPVTYTP
jgi:hypothetical protein